ncbi:Nn.00g082340.m01.CDS01 [Neocucurbitaria sp. VM-36]
MYFSSSIILATVIGFVQAQTPSGFTPQVNTKLDVLFNSTMVATPGQQLTKSGTASQPQIAVSSALASRNESFIFVMLDLDVPPTQGNTTRRVLLHAMNTGFKATQQRINGTAVLLASPEKGPAAYLPPGPPATDTVAHRYVQLLFRQPAKLDVAQSAFANTQDRINFNIASFASENGLSAPIAANFFRVDGRAGAGATGTATGTGGIARNTLQPFEGGAEQLGFSHGLVGLVGGLALFAL